MGIRFVAVLWLLQAVGAAAQSADPPRLRTRGYLAAEPRLFPQNARHPQQEWFHGSLAGEMELRHEWGERSRSLIVTPFARLDQNDGERSHLDLREAAFRYTNEHFELLAGVSKVFWGVTESQHLVDVVNQTDLVENLDGEDKLGQLMLHLTLTRRWGTLALFALPHARPRTFAGGEGRPRGSVLVNGDGAVFEAGRWHPGFAARWSKTLGVFDVGLSHFYGTSREPRFVLDAGDVRGARLVPHYDLIHQTGIDAQATVGRWLWKLEGIRRAGAAPAYVAATGGFEYSLANLGGSGIDVGLLAEYLYDDRGPLAPTPWQDDLFAGLRLAANDTQGSELLAGVIVDRESRATAWSVEANRRLGAHWKMGLEMRAFASAPPDDPLSEFDHDSYIQTELSYRF